MKELIIVYDGDCPVCRNYVRFIRLKETFGQVILIDARNRGKVVEGLIAKDINLDEGMVLLTGDQIYHGSECINMLALMSTKSGVFNKLNAFIFQSTYLSRSLYPFMRTGRNLLLKILNKKKLTKSGF